MKNYKEGFSILMITVLVMFASTVFANSVHFQVKGDGPVTGYFVGGSSSYTNVMAVVFGDTISNPTLVNNKESTFGQAFDFGSHLSGTNLIFGDIIKDTGDIWYSSLGMNSDHFNHFYFSSFNLPDGTAAMFVSFEDVKGLGDGDFNDMQMIFTNVSPVPEPETYAMMLAGLGLIGFISKRKV